VTTGSDDLPTPAQKGRTSLGSYDSILLVPDRTGHFQSLGGDTLAATLDRSRADLASLGSICWTVHAVAIVSEAGDGLARGLTGAGIITVLLEGTDHLL
jgi:hypothetical protein